MPLCAEMLSVLPALCLFAMLALLAAPSAAQIPIPSGGGSEETARPALPETLTPELIDATMARLSDAEVRALLREELQRQAEAQAAAQEEALSSVSNFGQSLAGMLGRIATRAEGWAVAIANIEERGPNIEERLAQASMGAWGMVGAFVLLAGAAFAAAYGFWLLTRTWREWLMRPERGSYWEKVIRILLIMVLGVVQVEVFVSTFALLAPALKGPLGPLEAYIWIFHSGIEMGWLFLVIMGAAFAPHVPALRIISLDDDAVAAIWTLTQRVVVVGVAGWLIAGLSPTLGLGFPPALITVALAGLIVTGILAAAAMRNHAAISASVAAILPEAPDGELRPLRRAAAVAAPWVALAYIGIAALYWMLHWLERGEQRLGGPAGTLVVLLVLPILDRLGLEIARTLTRRETARTLRFRQAILSIWRIALSVAAIAVVTRLWGFNFWDLAHGPGAPSWGASVLNIVWAAVIGWAVWQLIRAGLHSERRLAGDSEDDDPAVTGGASRLDTLLPLFRVGLLIVLVTTLILYALSEAGVNIGPLLASAGIIGIAVGFGAQTLVRDIFSGIFFLIDDAFRVGEYIELEDGIRGEVESISIRSLQLRHHRGPVVTIPFGELKSVTNHNRDWVIYKMNFRMEPETDPKVVKKLVKTVGAEFLAHPEHGPKFLEPLKSQGVYMVDDDSALVFRVKFKCRPRQQFVLRREIYHRLNEVFAENNVILARRKVEVVSSSPEEAAGAAEAALKQQQQTA
ncbi:MAG: mechanosensitive ion channel family protein [Pseudomonadota bacterium]